MAYILYTLFFISCALLIASVLLQPGKTDAGALFTSNISSTAFQPRGSQTILSKLTIIAATVFMLSALLLAMPALTGNLSVLQTTSDAGMETAPLPSTNANANTSVTADPNAAALPANTAIVVDSNQLTNANSSATAPVGGVANENK